MVSSKVEISLNLNQINILTFGEDSRDSNLIRIG